MHVVCNLNESKVRCTHIECGIESGSLILKYNDTTLKFNARETRT